MKSNYRVILAGTAGLLIGAATMSVLHAQTAEPQAYMISNVTEVKDAASLAKYQAQAPATQIAFGGHALVRGGVGQQLAGQSGNWSNTTPPKGRIVIVAFPNMKSLTDWWNSPAYSALRPIRENATTGQVYAVEGLPPS